MVKRTTLDQSIDIYLFLKDRVTVLENGICEYTENWDDGAISDKLGVTMWSVRSTRRKRFGKLKHEGAESVDLAPRVEALEKIVKDYENSIANLEAEVAALAKFARSKGYTSPNGRMQPPAVLKPWSNP